MLTAISGWFISLYFSKLVSLLLAGVLALTPMQFNLEDLNSTWDSEGWGKDQINEDIQEVLYDFEDFMEEYAKEWVRDNPPANGKRYTEEELREFKAEAEEYYFEHYANSGGFNDFMNKLNEDTVSYIKLVMSTDDRYNNVLNNAVFNNSYQGRIIVRQFFSDIINGVKTSW